MADDRYFEWRGTHDGLRHDPAGSFAMGTGVTWKQGDDPLESQHRDWFDRRYSRGFERGVSRQKYVYLLRYRTLAGLVALPDLSAQSKLLADWALESWDILEADPIPSIA